MTITKYDRVAILPKRCDSCNRLFWLEPYNVYYKEVGIEHYPLKQIECKNCIDKTESGYKGGKFDVLDKIKAEVIARAERIKAIRNDNLCYFTAEEVLRIIDCYKSESEE
jgi:hypothetical protein